MMSFKGTNDTLRFDSSLMIFQCRFLLFSVFSLSKALVRFTFGKQQTQLFIVWLSKQTEREKPKWS